MEGLMAAVSPAAGEKSSNDTRTRHRGQSPCQPSSGIAAPQFGHVLVGGTMIQINCLNLCYRKFDPELRSFRSRGVIITGSLTD